MAPIDLPPEQPLKQLHISRSAADLQIADQGIHTLLTGHHPSPQQAIHSSTSPTFSPASLLPKRQLSQTGSEDFSQPNLRDLVQLPPLPDRQDDSPISPTVDEPPSTIDSFTDESSDTDAPDIEKIDPEANADDIETADPQLDTDTTDADTTELDSNAPSVADPISDTADNDFDLNETSESAEDAEEDFVEPAISDDRESVDPALPSSENLDSSETAPPLDPAKLEITADTQIFDSERQVVNARGNVVFKLNNAFLLADELWVNLVNRYVLAEGNVILTRGEQEVRGERAEYNLLQEAGTIFETRGELFLPGLEDDFADPIEAPVTSRSVFDPLNPDQEVTNVSRAGGLELSSQLRGSTPSSLPSGSGGIRRLRFEAARVTFDAEAWVAEEVRLTNDPFSPPELEFRTNRMTLVTLSPTADLLTAENPRLVFDQGLALPLFKNTYVINRGAVDSNQVNPFLVSVGSDSRDRGGIFLESEFPVVRTETTNFTLTPQYFIERALDQGASDPEVFGLELDFDTRLSPRSDLSARATITGFDPDNIEENIRGNIRNRLRLGSHLLATEYSYRDRLFNGSLGFQTVRSSLGAVLLSPPINLDKRGLIMTYQVGGQWITADTDRLDLLDPAPRDNNRISLGRFQGSVRLGKGFNLWRGQPLPATQTEGLRYTPVPLVPFVNLNLGLQAVGSYYTSGDFQEVLAGDIRIDGQFGHLSDNFFDYTRFNLGYYRALLASENSPFLFDRNVDTSVLTFGVLQQIVGPILLGFQASINLETNERVNTEIIGEYSRRTYGLVVRYSPTQETGSIGFRLSDFNWLGSGSPFDNPNIRQVEGSVVDQR